MVKVPLLNGGHAPVVSTVDRDEATPARAARTPRPSADDLARVSIILFTGPVRLSVRVSPGEGEKRQGVLWICPVGEPEETQDTYIPTDDRQLKVFIYIPSHLSRLARVPLPHCWNRDIAMCARIAVSADNQRW